MEKRKTSSRDHLNRREFLGTFAFATEDKGPMLPNNTFDEE